MQHSWVCCPRSTFFSQRVWSVSHLDIDDCNAVAQSLLAQLSNRLDDRATGDCVFIYSVRSEACDTQSMLSDSTQWAESMTVAMSMLYGHSTGPPRMEVCMFD